MSVLASLAFFPRKTICRRSPPQPYVPAPPLPSITQSRPTGVSQRIGNLTWRVRGRSYCVGRPSQKRSMLRTNSQKRYHRPGTPGEGSQDRATPSVTWTLLVPSESASRNNSPPGTLISSSTGETLPVNVDLWEESSSFEPCEMESCVTTNPIDDTLTNALPLNTGSNRILNDDYQRETCPMVRSIASRRRNESLLNLPENTPFILGPPWPV